MLIFLSVSVSVLVKIWTNQKLSESAARKRMESASAVICKSDTEMHRIYVHLEELTSKVTEHTYVYAQKTDSSAKVTCN